VYNARNELEEILEGVEETLFHYDLNGNLVTRSGAAGTVQYSWDTQDRLIGASENGVAVFEAQYDYRQGASPRRRAMSGPTTCTRKASPARR